MQPIMSQRAIMNNILEKGCNGDSIMEGKTKPVNTIEAEQAADNEANAMLMISMDIMMLMMGKRIPCTTDNNLTRILHFLGKIVL